jgi:uncharacterized protein YbcV (DUF1398 family)
MNTNQIAVIEDCGARSLAGTITFPEVVRRLNETGVERYHADFSRAEKTYYLPGGQTHVCPLAPLDHPIAAQFSAGDVEASIRRSQRGQIKYVEFLRQVMAAGCVGYFVQITGRRAIYFGRDGDLHVEPFPTSPTP